MRGFRWQFLCALLAGLALRLFFVLRYPADSGDTPIYEALAIHWLRHGTFGVVVGGQLTPVDVRMPGYPGFLAGLYALTGLLGEAARPLVMFVQAVVDLFTCVLTAILAANLAPRCQRSRVSIAALWLAATCPFLANYVAVPLTEVWAAFFTVAALCALVPGLILARRWHDGEATNPGALRWLLGGFFIGLGTLFRPETLLLAVVAAAMLLLYWRTGVFQVLGRVALLAAALLLPLAPWAWRNWSTLHEVRVLAPRYAELPGELIPYGFMSWEKTWMVRLRDAYLVSWKLDDEPISIRDVSPSAFDSPQERARVAALLDRYNLTLTLTQKEDDGFAAVARERTVRHPLRTYLWIPLSRAVMLWCTPRIELLPFSGEVFPLTQKWREDCTDQIVSASLFFLNVFYVALALFGLWHLWRAGLTHRVRIGAALALIVLYMVLRTALLTTLETVEPRYTVVCFPLLLVLGAQALAPRTRG
jgi:hypothetical protein